MSRAPRGEEAFAAHYESLYGDRWDRLLDALKRPPRYAAVSHDDLPPYYLDEASLSAAEALGVVPGMQVVDLCAAPGGKTLVLAGALGGEGLLIANERSRSRRDRLRRVVETHLPPELKAPIAVTGHDATKWLLYETDAYDAGLLDVPCSAERHLLERPGELGKWSKARTGRLARQSYAMLASTLEIVRPGGKILYCTCTISPTENDEVVLRLLEKRSGRVEVLETESDFGTASPTGRMVLPDTDGGRGPLFYSLLRRIE